MDNHLNINFVRQFRHIFSNMYLRTITYGLNTFKTFTSSRMTLWSFVFHIFYSLSRLNLRLLSTDEFTYRMNQTWCKYHMFLRSINLPTSSRVTQITFSSYRFNNRKVKQINLIVKVYLLIRRTSFFYRPDM